MKQLTLLFVVLFLSACKSSATSTLVPGNEIMLGTMRDSNFGFLLGYTRQVYLLNPDGSGESNMKSFWISIDKPIWSPNGQWSAFDTRYSANEGSSIYVAKIDGSEPQRVSSHKNLDYHPSWSPDGTHIVYESNNTEHSQYLEEGIYTLDVSCILDNAPCNFSPTYLAEGSSPVWSPDGKQIAFQMECERDHQYCIYVISADGIDDSLRLSPLHLSCYNPQWSPTGAELIFICYNQSCCSDEEAGIYKAKSDGTEFEMTANIPEAWMPQWSPDGSKIAFMSSHSGDLGKMIGWEAGSTDALYIMEADGTGITRLSSRNDEDVFWFTWLPFSSRE